MPKSSNLRTHRAVCSKIYDKGWQQKVRLASRNTRPNLKREPELLLFRLAPDTKKSASELQQEQVMLAEIMRTVERRDALVSVLEEQRLKERAEDRDLEGLVLSKGYEFNWAPADNSWVGGGVAE